VRRSASSWTSIAERGFSDILQTRRRAALNRRLRICATAVDRNAESPPSAGPQLARQLLAAVDADKRTSADAA
jgi:hypothetical protein